MGKHEDGRLIEHVIQKCVFECFREQQHHRLFLHWLTNSQPKRYVNSNIVTELCSVTITAVTVWGSCGTHCVCVGVCAASWRRCFQASGSLCLLSGGSKTTMTATSWRTDCWDYRPSCKTWLHIKTFPTGMWRDAVTTVLKWRCFAFSWKPWTCSDMVLMSVLCDSIKKESALSKDLNAHKCILRSDPLGGSLGCMWQHSFL